MRKVLIEKDEMEQKPMLDVWKANTQHNLLQIALS